MPNTTQEVTDANQFMIDIAVATIKKLQAGYVEANKNYIRNSLLGIVYNAIENFQILNETQQSNIKTLKRQLINGGGTC